MSWLTGRMQKGLSSGSSGPSSFTRVAMAAQYFSQPAPVATSGSRTRLYGELPITVVGTPSAIILSNFAFSVGLADMIPVGNNINIVTHAIARGDRASFVPVTYGGVQALTLNSTSTTADTDIHTDAITASSLGYGSTFPNGTKLFFRFDANVATSGMNFPAGNGKGGTTFFINPATSTTNGWAVNAANAITLTPTGTSGTDWVNGATTWMPVVLGVYAADIKSMNFIGDSICQGTLDGGAGASTLGERGAFSRATLSSGTPLWASVNFGCPSGTGAAWSTANGIAMARPYLKYASDTFEEYATNTIQQTNNPTNLANAKTYSSAIWAAVKAVGGKVYRTHLLPRRDVSSTAISALSSDGTTATLTSTSALVANVGAGTVGSTGVRQVANAVPTGFNGNPVTVTVASATTVTFPTTAVAGAATTLGVWKDNYTTEANQLPYGAGNAWQSGGDADSFNQFCDASVGTLIDGVCPTTGMRGVSPFNWRVSATVQQMYNGDDTHPNDAGYTSWASVDIQPFMTALAA